MTDIYKARTSFKANGFSDRTIKALLAYGIDGPQQLLFMDPRAIRCIPGVGNFCMKEIERYRARFLDNAAVPSAEMLLSAARFCPRTHIANRIPLRDLSRE